MNQLSSAIKILFALFLITLALQPRQTQARSLVDIRLPVRESDFAVVQYCQRDSRPDCRLCLKGSPGNASLVNYSILQKALKTGGLQAIVKAVPSPNSERSRKMIIDGIADIKSDWGFNIDPAQNVLKSAPIMRNGEFQKGVYVSQETLHARAETPISDVHQMRAVSIRTWRLDWEVLQSLRPKSLISAPTTLQMSALINAGRADFTLLEFSSEPDMARKYFGIRLYPLHGVKVVLPGSQHFMVSRHLPDAEKIVAALDTGLKALHRSGFIHQCLVNSGIINERVKDWRILNAPDDPTAAEPEKPSH
ncbi:hypothetical protein HED22_07015 [Thalassospira sp. HF15]|uniref:hypothetical protein n=1 Tax=Thalassospira sp. HF15 TaxID=2722755 RepID=UPI0014315142|nr:hypothetical protein [Thalassospira sp. HF15]NIY75389.1 hypothetical protein [Thalassospira sp. HF15]